MELEPVSSSNINAIGYDADQKVLVVEFSNGGRYRYKDVPATEHTDLMKAKSVGSYFAANIRNAYKGERMPVEKKADE